jgi:hypothetical protein
MSGGYTPLRVLRPDEWKAWSPIRRKAEEARHRACRQAEARMNREVARAEAIVAKARADYRSACEAASRAYSDAQDADYAKAESGQ